MKTSNTLSLGTYFKGSLVTKAFYINIRMAVSILDPLVDKAGGVRKTSGFIETQYPQLQIEHLLED